MHTARIIIGSALALALSGISIICCYVFGTHLAPSFEGQLYGVLGATADALKAILPIGIGAALAAGQRGRAAIGALLFVVFSIYSFASELGLYSLSRDAQSSTATASREGYQELKSERAAIASRLHELGATRPSGTVQADIAAAKLAKPWAASAECRDVTSTASRELCGRIEHLTGELAGAVEAEKLRSEDAKLSAKLSGVDLAAALKSADPQSEALGRMLGLAPGSVKDGLAVLIAILIELGSGFGLYAATSASAASFGETPIAPVPAMRGAKAVDDPVKAFAKAMLNTRKAYFAGAKSRLSSASPGGMPASEVLQAFERWARADGAESMTATLFGRRMTELGYQRGKKGGKAFYPGIALKEEKTPAKPAKPAQPVRRLRVVN